MRTCDNCGAKVPDGQGGVEPLHGRFICCPACLFNPLGCRCQYGEFEVAETQDWYIPEDDDPVYEDIDWGDGEE